MNRTTQSPTAKSTACTNKIIFLSIFTMYLKKQTDHFYRILSSFYINQQVDDLHKFMLIVGLQACD